MDEKFLVVNTGSASKKYACYQGGEEKLKAHFEREGKGFVVTISAWGETHNVEISEDDFENAIHYTVETLKYHHIINDAKELVVVGIRVVAPGSFFQDNRVVDKSYLSKLSRVKEQAPLHIGPVNKEIGYIKIELPEAKLVGVSDSQVHKDIVPEARNYAISWKDSQRYDLYRFGYHGISVQSVVRVVSEAMGMVAERMIVCHLGGGASVTALKNGKSVDTSMGLTPLEGLVMNSRVGDVDPGVVVRLSKKKRWKLPKVEEYLNKESGMLGLSGKSGDVRELLKLEAQGDERAALALNSFAYRVKKYIGAYSAVLGGLDMLVLTATIGERSDVMRARILTGLEYLGVKLDAEKNKQGVNGLTWLEAEGAGTRLAVVPTDELREIYLRSREVVEG